MAPPVSADGADDRRGGIATGFSWRRGAPHVGPVQVDVARARGDPVQGRVGHQLALDPQVPPVGSILPGRARQSLRPGTPYGEGRAPGPRGRGPRALSAQFSMTTMLKKR